MTPDERGHTPQYGSARYETADRHNRLLHLLGGTGEVPSWPTVHRAGQCIQLHQDANIFVSGRRLLEGLHLAEVPRVLCVRAGLESACASHTGTEWVAKNLPHACPTPLLTCLPSRLPAENDAGQEHQVTLGPHRQAYLVCIEGGMAVSAPQGSETQLAARDAAQLVAGPKPLHLTLAAGSEGAHFMLIEMQQKQ